MAASSSIGSAGRDVQLYEYGPLRFAATDDCDRHLVLDHAVTPEAASHRERFEAIARTQRDLLSPRWVPSQKTYLSYVRPPAVGKHHRAKNESVSKTRR